MAWRAFLVRCLLVCLAVGTSLALTSRQRRCRPRTMLPPSYLSTLSWDCRGREYRHLGRQRAPPTASYPFSHAATSAGDPCGGGGSATIARTAAAALYHRTRSAIRTSGKAIAAAETGDAAARLPLWRQCAAAVANVPRPSRLQVVATVLTVLMVREYWRKVPPWLQHLLLQPWRRGVVAPARRLVRRFAPGAVNATVKMTDLASSSTSKLPSDNDLDDAIDGGGNFDFDFDDSGLLSKLQMVMALVQSAKATVQFERAFQMEFAVLAMLQMVRQSKRTTAVLWDAFYESCGTPLFSIDDHQDDSTIREQFVLTMIDQLHLSDWAYLEDTEEIRSKLNELTVNSSQQQSWHLVRHVKTAEPGRVGHYVAVDSQRKVALIAVKGTSALSDMFTDVCGVPVRYNLTTTTFDGRSSDSDTTLLSCHEGILDASLALLEDVQPIVEHLFLPAGYRVLLVGHSLGAGCACLLGWMLRSRLPALRRLYDFGGELSLQVVAFAPPPMLSWEAAAATATFTTSVVNNDDVIPRASLSNLVSLLRFLVIINARLEERGLCPAGFHGAVTLLKRVLVHGLSNGGDDSEIEAVMTAQEIFDGLNEARCSEDLDPIESMQAAKEDMDHLFVPGKVIVLYEKHVQEDVGTEGTTDTDPPNESTAVEEILSTEAVVAMAMVGGVDEVDEATTVADPEVAIEAGVLVADGAASVLKHINMNDRMFSDHTPDAYEKTLRALL